MALKAESESLLAVFFQRRRKTVIKPIPFEPRAISRITSIGAKVGRV